MFNVCLGREGKLLNVSSLRYAQSRLLKQILRVESAHKLQENEIAQFVATMLSVIDSSNHKQSCQLYGRLSLNTTQQLWAADT